jgi:F-type H+-transporting ATPase subunit delta
MAMAVGNRYARALAEALGRQGDYRRVLGELDDFAATYRASAELRSLLESPAVKVADKSSLLMAILERMAAAPVTANFLRVLLANYRVNLIDQIRQAFRKLAYQRLGVTEVRIESAARLSETQQQTLRARFAELTGGQVEMGFHLNPDLLGGVLAQIQSTVYDGSIRGSLERIRQQLGVRF